MRVQAFYHEAQGGSAKAACQVFNSCCVTRSKQVGSPDGLCFSALHVARWPSTKCLWLFLMYGLMVWHLWVAWLFFDLWCEQIWWIPPISTRSHQGQETNRESDVQCVHHTAVMIRFAWSEREKDRSGSVACACAKTKREWTWINKGYFHGIPNGLSSEDYC